MTEAGPGGGESRRHRLLRMAAGEDVFREGEIGTEMYIIQKGQVEILQRAGGRLQRLAVLEKGDFFGEMSMLEDLPRSATARAVEPTQLVEISRSTFEKMLRDNPEIAVRIMRKLSRRVREADRRLSEAEAEAAQVPALAGPAEPAVTMAHSIVQGHLEHAPSGARLALPGDATVTIGRRDPATGLRPTVDLTAVDRERSVSRRHAKLQRRDDRLFLVEDLGTTNGTWVNGERIRQGEPVEVHGGDALRFGLVELTYHAP